MKRGNFLKSLLGLPFVFSLLSLQKRPEQRVTVFTPEMLSRHNYGLFIINARVKEINNENISFASTMAYKLGYCMNWGSNYYSNYYTMSNFLTDGFTFPVGRTKEQVCDYLNDNPYKDKYRLMSKEEVIFVLSNRKQGFLES